jgi:TolB-like protein/Tfp pilus assembly protein PilF
MSPDNRTAEEAGRALSRLLAAPGLQVSERNKRFLRYVVEETLAGRGERIKSYTIAVDVFGRGADFDGAVDSIVRTEATRLRVALAKYYAGDGANDPIRITLPPGSYVPRFERLTVAEAPAADEGAPDASEPDASEAPAPAQPRGRVRWRLVGAGVALTLIGALAFSQWLPHGKAIAAPIVVLAMTQPIGAAPNIGSLSRGLGESLVLALTRYRGFVVARAAEPQTPDVILAHWRDANRNAYLLESSVDNDLVRLRFRWRLIDPTDQRVLWSDQVDEPLQGDSALNIEDQIAGGVARIIASQGGIVSQNEAHDRAGHSSAGYACVLEGYAYLTSQSILLHAEARDCLERTIAQEPDYVDALALLSYIYNDEDRQGFNPRGDKRDIAARAMAVSDRALKLAPTSSLVMLTRSTVLFQNGDYAGFEAAAHKAIALNPNNPDNYAFAGNRLFALGRYEEGAALVRQAIAMDPSPPATNHAITLLDAYRLGDFQAAAKEAESLHLDPARLALSPIIAAIYGELGDKAKAAPYLDNILRSRPNYAATFRAELINRHFQPDLIERVADGLRKAGLPVE